MALPLETVVKQLADSGIIAPGKLDDFVPPKAAPKDGEALLRKLHKQGLLTKFQAQQVAANKTRALLLGEYTILDRIGAGGMGQVFKAVHRRMDRIVAIKMLPSAMTKDAASMARFEREVRAAAKLSHPNIVAAYDAGQANNAHFLVMEYVEGSDLSALVKKDGPFPVGKAVNYILQAARGLEFAHSEGVVHRDIKPANLLLDKKGVVKILDMGLARIDSDGPAQSELTSTGTVMGTVDYMSPEQALNTKDADQRADIYSLGMSLYFLLAGKAAYGGDTAMEKLMAHQTQPIPSLQDTQTTVSKQLDAVFNKMVAKRIEDRYQSMAEVVEALAGLGLGGSVTASKSEIASTLALSSEDRKKLMASKATKKPLGSLTDVVASEKARNLVAKIVGGAFATIIAPILVTYLIKSMEQKGEPPKPPAAAAPAATVPPEVVATHATTQPTVHATSRENLSSQPWNTPAFEQWMHATQALNAKQQLEVVSRKLKELNPGFDGQLTSGDGRGSRKIENGVVALLKVEVGKVSDLSPVRALVHLRQLTCTGKSANHSKFSNLSPLAGMALTRADFSYTDVSDLRPLIGMPLEELRFESAKVADLSPLSKMPLTNLVCFGNPISDLSPLLDCKGLTRLDCRQTKVTAAQVAALQKTLPNCKIEWDGAPSASPPGEDAKPKTSEPAASGTK